MVQLQEFARRWYGVVRRWLGTPSAKLALAYVAILMALSISFSLVFYHAAGAQLAEGLRHQYTRLSPGGPGFGGRFSQPFGPGPMQIQAELETARQGLRLNLIYFNALVLVLGTALSYWLAKRTVRPIEAALDAQTRFTADASHELRTPLAVMQTGIETVRRDPKVTKDDALAMLDSNLEEVHKLQTLSAGLLRLARSDQQPVELAPVSLAVVTSAAIDRLAPAAKARRLTVVNDAADQTVMGDEPMLTELLVILLDNAVKYSSPGQTILATTASAGKYAEVSIKDTGRGIAAADLPRIFERFFRADASRTNADVEGHGLGLSIAENIAQLHHGQITVTSAPGQGSTFTVALPSA